MVSMASIIRGASPSKERPSNFNEMIESAHAGSNQQKEGVIRGERRRRKKSSNRKGKRREKIEEPAVTSAIGDQEAEHNKNLSGPSKQEDDEYYSSNEDENEFESDFEDEGGADNTTPKDIEYQTDEVEDVPIDNEARRPRLNTEASMVESVATQYDDQLAAARLVRQTSFENDALYGKSVKADDSDVEVKYEDHDDDHDDDTYEDDDEDGKDSEEDEEDYSVDQGDEPNKPDSSALNYSGKPISRRRASRRRKEKKRTLRVQKIMAAANAVDVSKLTEKRFQHEALEEIISNLKENQSKPAKKTEHEFFSSYCPPIEPELGTSIRSMRPKQSAESDENEDGVEWNDYPCFHCGNLFQGEGALFRVELLNFVFQIVRSNSCITSCSNIVKYCYRFVYCI
jgi:hypothetical protein